MRKPKVKKKKKSKQTTKIYDNTAANKLQRKTRKLQPGQIHHHGGKGWDFDRLIGVTMVTNLLEILKVSLASGSLYNTF